MPSQAGPPLKKVVASKRLYQRKVTETFSPSLSPVPFPFPSHLPNQERTAQAVRPRSPILLDPNPSSLDSPRDRKSIHLVSSTSIICIRFLPILLQPCRCLIPVLEGGAKTTMPESPSRQRFSGLRGARWRADLGVLPGSAAVPIDELRRAAADSRRRSGLGELRFLLQCFDSGEAFLARNALLCSDFFTLFCDVYFVKAIFT